MSKDKEREAFEALKDLMHTIHIGFAIKSTQEARAGKAIRTLESALEQARATLATQPPAVQGEPLYGFSREQLEDMRLRFAVMSDFYSKMAVELIDGVLASPPPREPLTDEQIEDCIDEANRLFNQRRSGPHGQQMSPYDDWKYWLARAIERAHGIHSREGGSK